MSYEIVKGIKIEDNKVFVKADSNNVYPKHFDWWDSISLTKTYQEQGQVGLDIELLKAYESGNFQAGSKNKYTRALEVLRHFEEYKRFSWRTDIDNNDLRESKEFDNLLMKALSTKLPKQKYLIIKDYFGKRVYFYHRKNSGCCSWYSDKEKAKRFNYEEDAKNTISCFQNSENWEVIPI